MKFHLSLNVSDLERSVAFYRSVFGQEPAKCRADYAKFEVEDPPLVLSLEPVPASVASGRGALNHVGLRFPDSAALVDVQRRLELAGFACSREEGVECCYAKQTKFWLNDPDGTLWEFYVLEGDIEHRGLGQAPESLPVLNHPATRSANGGAAKSEAAAQGRWEHRLGEPIPAALDLPDGSLNEVLLRGTFNGRLDPEARQRLLGEARRVLREGGRVLAHVLTSAAPLRDPSPRLSGPASVVRIIPAAAALCEELSAAGFRNIVVERPGGSPCFTVEGIELHETMVSAAR